MNKGIRRAVAGTRVARQMYNIGKEPKPVSSEQKAWNDEVERKKQEKATKKRWPDR